PERAAGTGAVVRHQRLPHLRGHLLPDGAAHHVAGRARRERQDQLDRLAGIVLRQRRCANQKRRHKGRTEKLHRGFHWKSLRVLCVLRVPAFKVYSAFSDSTTLRSMTMPSLRRRSRSRIARSDGMRISSTPCRRGVALIWRTYSDIWLLNSPPGSMTF